jgi:glycosyltransferase involved in cell wall biosynthesis
LVRDVSGVIFHTHHDAALMTSVLGAGAFEHVDVEIAPHGPYNHLTWKKPNRTPPHGPTRVLSFGLIRPYKGVEDLIAAYDGMTEEDAARFLLDVVGETWEGWTTPAEAIAASRYGQRIRFTNRYVSDREAAEHFALADVLVLPYRRGSASGPLQIAMNNGIFVVLYAVGGLVEAVRDYPGAILVAPNDIDGLRTALLSLPGRRSQRFADPHCWSSLTSAITALADAGARR